MIAIAVTGVSILPCHAEVDELVREAQAAAAQGKSQQSFDLLAPKEVERAGDPDFDLALGIAANGSGQYTRAIMALERVVAIQPENAQARGELGRALFGVGDRKAARVLLNESKLEGIPTVAGESIDQLLQAVDRVEASGQSSFKGYIEAAGGEDSNVNAGPATRNLAVPAFGGALTDIHPSGVQTRARYLNLTGGLSGRLVLDPRWSLIGNGSVGARRHTPDGRRVDFVFVDFNAGISYRVERHEYTLVAQVGTYDIDNARVRDSRGGVAEWTYRFDGFRQFSVYGQFGRLAYPQQPQANTDRRVIGTTYAQLARTGLFGYGGLYAGREVERSTGNPHLGHSLAGLRGGLQQPIGATVAVFVTMAFEKRRFGGEDPLFLVQRRDRQANASVGISWVPAPSWRITPQFALTQTRSNVPLADYRRQVVSVAVRREF